MLRPKSGKPDATAKPQTGQLSDHLTFLDVVRDCCDRSGRFTATAQSPEAVTYTVLVDRGGPFNVSGGGLTGTDALMAAARLSSGTFTIAEGWPVAQPLYQIGLDATLKMLSTGTLPAVVGDLPSARGVDSQRDAQPRATSAPAQTYTPNPSTPLGLTQATVVSATLPPPPLKPTSTPAPIASATLPPPPPLEPTSTPAPIASATLPPPPLKPTSTLPPPTSTLPPPSATPPPSAGPAAETIPNTPVYTPPPMPLPASAAEAQTKPVPLVDRLVPPMPVNEPAEEAGALLPGGPTASADQGSVKHLVTQSMLWLVQIDEPERYNIRQARLITTRAIGGSVRGLVHPFQHRAKASWQQAKQDWEKSGEVAARQKRQRRRVREVDVDPRSGPLSGR